MKTKHRITVKEGRPTRAGSVLVDVRPKKGKKGQYRVIIEHGGTGGATRVPTPDYEAAAHQ